MQWKLERLAEAEQHLAQGAVRIERQRRLIAELHRDGRDTTRAEDLLKTFLEIQSMQERDRDQLRATLLRRG
jgi:hypothetical protein